MCGRYTYLFEWAEIARLSGLTVPVLPGLDAPRYNVAPTQKAPVVRQTDGERAGAMLTWGLVPGWSKDPSIGSKMVHARSETVREKPSFREAWQHRRAIVPISGFYEWSPGEPFGLTRKVPHYVTLVDRAPMLLAGLWERHDQAGETFSILTCAATGRLAQMHERVPVLIEPAHVGPWLSGDAGVELMRAYPDDSLAMHIVSTRVNNVRNTDAGLIEESEVEDRGGQGMLF